MYLYLLHITHSAACYILSYILSYIFVKYVLLIISICVISICIGSFTVILVITFIINWPSLQSCMAFVCNECIFFSCCQGFFVYYSPLYRTVYLSCC